MKTIKVVTDINELRVLLSLEEIKNSKVFGQIFLEGVWFALYQGDYLAGIIGLKPINTILWVPHIFIIEQYRGAGSEKWGKLAARFMKKNCGAKKFLVLTPSAAAASYAQRMGFKSTGILKGSVEHNNEIVDQWIMELGVGVI